METIFAYCPSCSRILPKGLLSCPDCGVTPQDVVNIRDDGEWKQPPPGSVSEDQCLTG